MPGLHLHTSNRLENLFVDLAAIVARPLGPVLQPETIVVQSVGMGRWLSLRLAEAHGICANVRFPFPQKFVAEMFQAALPETSASESYDRDILPWRIMQLLPGLLGRAEFEPVRHYLAGERPALKLYQLSQKIAEVFDRYLAFRPRMILDWDAGKDDEWQAILWRSLAFSAGVHQPQLAREFEQRLRAGSSRAALPPRVSIFGLSTLPEFYLSMVQALATQIDVHLFVMEPTDQWWRDLVSAREESRLLKTQPGRTAADLHLERGNPLLASMGKLGSDFLGLVWSLEPEITHETFAEPQGNSTLSQVQQEIYLLQEKHVPVVPNDSTIQFHSCASPMREMEVLHDQLLAAFERDPELQPRDIVVMMPDVAAYAPFIEAVFATPESETLRIPFAIADRSARAENSVVDNFLAILELSGTRMGASSVLNILESPEVLQRFDLAEADLETIRVWLDRAAIRWGIDSAHRTEFDLPAFGQNSWREGLDRLLLGYAMPLHGEQLFHGLLPIDEVEGSLAETLGDFVEFADALFSTHAAVKAPRRLGEWQTLLRQIVERFFVRNDETARDLLQVLYVLDSLGKVALTSGFEAEIPFEVILAHLSRTLGESESGSGFLVGRVTFCALKPMRSIPFKVVCLVGMNDTAYPRSSAAIGFDLMARHPRAGDRSTRDDDRYLFLEALLSARELFYVSYVGQSLKDGSPLPPSVLVSELLDYLGGESARDSLVTRHRLQPFHPAYFEDESPLFSYSVENCEASTVAQGERFTPAPFFIAPLSPPEEDWRRVTLEDLVRFYRNSAQFFLQNRLQIKLPREEEILEDREPFAVDNLTRYQVEQDLLAKSLGGASLLDLEDLVRAGGQFPAGAAGSATYRELALGVENFAEIVRPYTEDKLSCSTTVDLTLEDWSLTGRIDGLTDNGLFFYRLTKAKPLDFLRVWLSHLALNISAPTSARLIAEDGGWQFPPLEPAQGREQLLELLELYGRGLCEPLPFFPKSSLAFAEQTYQPRGAASPLKKAHDQWDGSGWGVTFAEKDNAYISLGFRNAAEPLDATWEEISLRVFLPLLKAREALP